MQAALYTVRQFHTRQKETCSYASGFLLGPADGGRGTGHDTGLSQWPMDSATQSSNLDLLKPILDDTNYLFER